MSDHFGDDERGRLSERRDAHLPALPEWRDLPKRVAALEREVAAMRGAESHPSAARTEETPQSGLRTERVTLEISHNYSDSLGGVSGWDWETIIGESMRAPDARVAVRVVPPGEADSAWIKCWKKRHSDCVSELKAADAEVERLRRHVGVTKEDIEFVRRSYIRMAAERDDAIRERDAALARVGELEASVLHCEQCNQAWSAEAVRLREDIAHAVRYRREAEAERDAALARVAEFEAAAKSFSTVIVNGEDMVTLSEFLRHTTALAVERDALKARVVELEEQRADAEPVAWRVTADDPPPVGQMVLGRWDHLICGKRTVSYGEVVNTSGFPNVWWRAASFSERIPPKQWRPLPPGPREDRASWEVEPAADRDPPPPRGWLTERDRQTMIAAAVFCSGRGEKGISEALEWILARNSPPTVRLPENPFARSNVAYGDWMMCLEAVKKALAAAGVEVSDE